MGDTVLETIFPRHSLNIENLNTIKDEVILVNTNKQPGIPARHSPRKEPTLLILSQVGQLHAITDPRVHLQLDPTETEVDVWHSDNNAVLHWKRVKRLQ